MLDQPLVEGHEVLCFCSAGEELAVAISKVREIEPGAAFVRSMAPSGDKFILVLDVDAVLDGVELEEAPTTSERLQERGAALAAASSP